MDDGWIGNIGFQLSGKKMMFISRLCNSHTTHDFTNFNLFIVWSTQGVSLSF
jgi:hypothetical protein